VENPPWQAQLLQPSSESKVIAHIVTNVPASQESRLGDVNEVLQRPLHAIAQNEHDKLHIGVKQGQRPVALKLIPRFARFEDKADDSTEQLSKRGVASGITESVIEDPQQEGHEQGLKLHIKLVREPVSPRRSVPASASQSKLHLLPRQQAIPARAFCLRGLGW
jgi:hypothetical protein